MIRLVVLLSLMIALPAAAAAEAPSPAASAEAEAPRPARLKFKSRGPVCLCGNGLSEKDIERAAKRTADGPAEPHPSRSEK
jgi:hypothetical protein